MPRLHSVLTVSFCLTAAFIPSNAVNAAPYDVNHPYSTDLGSGEQLRGVWFYRNKTLAKKRGSKRAEINNHKGTVTLGPTLFDAPTNIKKSRKATQGGATANANSRVSFAADGGFHRVDGDATIAGDGWYARAFSSSKLALNQGVPRSNGTVKWKPNWVVDRIRGSSRAGRDPVDISVTNLDTGHRLDDHLFDLQFHLGPGGSGSWEDGRLQLDGFDGSFYVSIEGNYLTSPKGSMLLEFDPAGRVTRSEDSGVFNGLLPLVNESARLDLLVSDYVGEKDGTINLDFDFGMESGNLEFDADLGGNGIAQAMAGSPDTIHDFSFYHAPQYKRPMMGTSFHTQRGAPPADVIHAEEVDDEYAGFVRLGNPSSENARDSAIAFDQTNDRPSRQIHSMFDFRLNGIPNAPGSDQPASLKYRLLPSEVFGTTGPIEQLSEQAGLELVIQAGQNQENIVLLLDGQPVGHAATPELAQQFTGNWNTAHVIVESVPHGTVVDVAIADGDDGLFPLMGVFLEGLQFNQVRPAFAANTNGQGTADIDNFEVDFVLFGDIDLTDTLDVADIDALTRTIASGQYDDGADMNLDGQVDRIDLDVWVVDLIGTWYGDTNVDGVFDSTDVIQAFAAGKFEQDEAARWSDGDWNGDGRFNSSDMILAFQDGGYGMGRRAQRAVAAVPEPSTVTMLAIACLAGAATTARSRPQRSRNGTNKFQAA